MAVSVVGGMGGKVGEGTVMESLPTEAASSRPRGRCGMGVLRRRKEKMLVSPSGVPV